MIREEHEKAHYKTEKIYDRIKIIAIGILRAEVKSVIDACVNCQVQSSMQTYNAIKPIIAKHVFHRFQMDLMCLTAYGNVNEDNKYIWL